MKHICMDCKKELLRTPDPAWWKRAPVEAEPVSHGLCAGCKDVRIAEYRAEMVRRSERADMELPVDVVA